MKKWYSGLLKDYTSVLIWDRGGNGSLSQKIVNSLLGDEPYTVVTNRLLARLALAKRIDHLHANIVFYLDAPLIGDFLSEFIRTEREHDTTLIVVCNDLQYLGNFDYRFDIVFHAAASIEPATSKYQQWINEANQEGILLTQSVEWLKEKNPQVMEEYAVLGVYVL